MSNYPPGAANDPNAPYNEPLTKYAKIRAEVTVDIGAMVDVFVEVDEDIAETISTSNQFVDNKPRFTLSWSHYLILMRIENTEARNFYEIECAQQQWSVRQLSRQVGSCLYS